MGKTDYSIGGEPPAVGSEDENSTWGVKAIRGVEGRGSLT